MSAWTNSASWAGSTPVPVQFNKTQQQKTVTTRLEATEILQRHSDNTSNPLVPPGVITAFATLSAPKGYLLCDGSEVLRADYPGLFSAIGTRYGSGDNSTTFNVPSIAGLTANTDSVYRQGTGVDKDCSLQMNDELISSLAPNNVAVSSGTFSCMQWDDWDDDIFDDFGNFYIFNPATNEYYFLTLNIDQMNGNDRDIFTEEFNAFEQTFSATYGYLTRGVFRLQIRCYNYDFNFIVGFYGDMGSDGSTVNTDQQSNFTLGSTNLTLYYNRNVEEDDEIERFFTYVIPMDPSQNETRPYTKLIDPDESDELSIYTNEIHWGVNLYFSKTNDVRQVVKADLQFGEGDIYGGNIEYDGSDIPIIDTEEGGVSTSYIIKY